MSELITGNPLKLMVESGLREYDIICEQNNPNEPKFLKIRGPYIVMDERNANGRIYPKQLMMPVIEQYITDMIDTGMARGELNHPEHLEIDPDRICHRMTSLKNEGNIWVGESIVLCSSPDGTIKGTPCGDILAADIQHGGRPGMSTRGGGDVDDAGTVTEYYMKTVDCVTDPSGPGCFVNGIMESKRFMIDTHGTLIEMAYNKLENGIHQIKGNSVKSIEESIEMAYLIKQFLAEIRVK